MTDEKTGNDGRNHFNIQRFFHSKHRIPMLEGPSLLSGLAIGPSVHLWIKLLQRSFIFENNTSESERLGMASCHISTNERSSVRLVLETYLEISNANTFEEFKQAMINNLAPATSMIIYEQFEELYRIPWNKSTNITAYMNQVLSFLIAYCEEADARCGIKIEKKVQNLLLISMLSVKLPSKALKAEVDKAFTTDDQENRISKGSQTVL
ncbi:UNVERIFIED_CONTAM: hypothetical protein RMT77_011049 [Armadillidium vulgare]